MENLKLTKKEILETAKMLETLSNLISKLCILGDWNGCQETNIYLGMLANVIIKNDKLHCSIALRLSNEIINNYCIKYKIEYVMQDFIKNNLKVET